MLAQFKLWLASKNITTHSVAAAYATLLLFYSENAPAREYLQNLALQLYHRIPHSLAQFIVLVIIPFYTWYRSGLTKPGKEAVKQALKGE